MSIYQKHKSDLHFGLDIAETALVVLALLYCVFEWSLPLIGYQLGVIAFGAFHAWYLMTGSRFFFTRHFYSPTRTGVAEIILALIFHTLVLCSMRWYPAAILFVLAYGGFHYRRIIEIEDSQKIMQAQKPFSNQDE